MYNKIDWVIQTNLLNDYSVQVVWSSAEEYGCGVHEAIIIPFQDELGNEEYLQSLKTDDRVIIPYGSCKLTRISQQRGWRGNCYNEETFRANVWNEMRDDMLNSDASFMQVKDTTEFLKGVDDMEQFFIRPLKDLKQFAGTVTEAFEIRNWMNSVYSGNFSFSEDTEIAISPVKKIYSEARYFIVSGKVVDGSYYRLGKQFQKHNIKCQDTLNKAQELANKWLPHECCVMDIADTDDGFKVIEFNTINSSGFYDNDIKKIVQAMTNWAKEL